jgi:hypothetical protein
VSQTPCFCCVHLSALQRRWAPLTISAAFGSQNGDHICEAPQYFRRRQRVPPARQSFKTTSITTPPKDNGSGDVMNNDLSQSPLVEYALRGLKRCFMPAVGLWSFRYWLDGRVDPNLSVPSSDLFYSMNVLLGFSRVPGRIEEYGFTSEQLYRTIAARMLNAKVRHYAFGMALWAAAELGVEVPTPVAERVREMTRDADDVIGSWLAQDVGLILSGLVAQSRIDPRWRPIAEQFRNIALQHFLGRHDLFFDAGKGVRRYFSTFATQVYLTLGLYHYGELANDAEALTVADACIHKLLKLQGPYGEWPWFYNAGTGAVVDFYEVYSVHQHGMAPAILHHAVDRNLAGTRAGLVKGFNWIFGENEMHRSMLRPELHLIHRSQARAGLQGTRNTRAARAIVNTLRGRNDHIMDRGGEGLIITPEVRSYELGWILWSFGSRLDYPELTHRDEFRSALARADIQRT